jgi:hypothetical protein
MVKLAIGTFSNVTLRDNLKFIKDEKVIFSSSGIINLNGFCGLMYG